MRYTITKDDVKLISRLYLDGDTVSDICYKTDYPIHVIKKVLRDSRACIDDDYTKTTSLESMGDGNDIKSLYCRGYSIECISHILNITIKKVMEILKGLYEYNDHPFDECISVDKLQSFGETIKPGDTFILTVERDKEFPNILYGNTVIHLPVTVIKKYSNFVVTDKGCFQYFDFYTGKRVS